MEAWLVDQYIHSRASIPDQALQNLLDLWVRGSRLLPSFSSFASREKSPSVEDLAPKSKELMEKHYNLPLALMENCLGPTMKYSMALWERGAHDLEEAQMAMMEDLCQKARIVDGDAILDLGCGFGSLAAFILQRFPQCRVAGLNLSQVHCQYIRSQQKKAKSPLSSSRFTLIEEDFNHFKSDVLFDRIVSVGFFEHVRNLEEALARISTFLSPEGSCFLHYIVSQGVQDSASGMSQGFIQHYIFPGSTIHDHQELSRHQDHLKVKETWFLNGQNYEKTLAAWLDNFQSRRESIRLKAHLDESMLRLWHLYLRASMAVFRLNGGKSYGNGQYLLEPIRSLH